MLAGRRISAWAVLGLLTLTACRPVSAARPTGTRTPTRPAITHPIVESPTSIESTTTLPPATEPPNSTTTTEPAASTTTEVPPRSTTEVPTTTTTTDSPTTTTTIVSAPSGWTLVGGDEFNGTAVDGSKWKTYHSTYGDGNHELACLTPENVIEAGGSLQITSKRQTATCPGGRTRSYTSGFLGSREVGRYYPMYGRFEARLKVPHAQGLWPAFWLRHRNGASTAEVDILEYFHSQRPGQGSAALHLDGVKNVLKKNVPFESAQGASGWHVWAVEISPTAAGPRFEFFRDGTSYGSFVDTKHAWASSDPAATWDIALNQAVGGNPTGEPDGTLGYLPNLGRCSIGGTAPAGCTTTGINRVDWTRPTAATYSVDYVRVFTR